MAGAACPTPSPAAAAGSTVSTPTTRSPNSSGSPWTDRTPSRAAIPGAMASGFPSSSRTGRRSCTTADIRGEPATGIAWCSTRGPEPGVVWADTDCR
jgi:hypothetical protein